MALRIKDNIDLKELEKFGFEYHRMIYVKDTKRSCCNLEENKKIYVEENSRNISMGIGIFNTDMELDTLYDLIKADMVEKVDD